VLTDTHCHLDFNAFDEDRVEVLDRSRLAGVTRLLIPGLDLDSCRKALELAEVEPELFIAVGVHPNQAGMWTRETTQQLRDLVSHPKVVAIGEIGLDYYRKWAAVDLQQKIFQEQLDLAGEKELPVIVHNRQASQDIMKMLSAWYAYLQDKNSPIQECPGVLHSFSENADFAYQAIAMNFFIGFTGPVTFQNARELQHVAASVPMERILIETDAPFLTPHPFRGRRNEPAHVRLIAEKLAELRGEEFSSIAQQTTANAFRLFQW
jgi:TatD DNase family protein